MKNTTNINKTSRVLAKTHEDLDDNCMYRLTPWGCLVAVLMEHDIDVSDEIDGEEGAEIVDEFMEVMIKAGHVKKKKEKNKKDIREKCYG